MRRVVSDSASARSLLDRLSAGYGLSVSPPGIFRGGELSATAGPRSEDRGVSSNDAPADKTPGREQEVL